MCTGRAGVRAAGWCRGEVCTPEARRENGAPGHVRASGGGPTAGFGADLLEKRLQGQRWEGEITAGTQWATRRQKRHADPGCSLELCCLTWRPLALSSYLSESKSNNGDIPDRPVVKTALPLQGAWVQFMVGELRSHRPGSQKKIKTEQGQFLSHTDHLSSGQVATPQSPDGVLPCGKFYGTALPRGSRAARGRPVIQTQGVRRQEPGTPRGCPAPGTHSELAIVLTEPITLTRPFTRSIRHALSRTLSPLSSPRELEVPQQTLQPPPHAPHL